MIIYSEAPNRVLDFGGWSDTPFAGQEKALNFAVTLYPVLRLLTAQNSDARRT